MPLQIRLTPSERASWQRGADHDEKAEGSLSRFVRDLVNAAVAS